MTTTRAGLIAALATVYVIAWWAFESPAPAGARPAASVWYADLPPGERPSVTLPAGWTLAPRPPAAEPPAPAPAMRIRTRSS